MMMNSYFFVLYIKICIMCLEVNDVLIVHTAFITDGHSVMINVNAEVRVPQ